MITQELLDTFDHLINMLQDEGVDAIVISMVEDAKEAMEEHDYEPRNDYDD